MLEAMSEPAEAKRYLEYAKEVERQMNMHLEDGAFVNRTQIIHAEGEHSRAKQCWMGNDLHSLMRTKPGHVKVI